MPKPLHLDEARGFSFTGTDLAPLLSPRTKLIYLCFPSNPTGGVASPAQLQEIAAVVRERCGPDVRVYADEVYEDILFDGSAHHSIASCPGMAERTILVSGASKSFAWTGGRIGWALFPTKEEAESFRTLNINYFSCIPAYNQEGYPNPNENPYVKQIASEFEIADIDSETGDPITRPGTTSDRFPSPFANAAAAAASNGGAVPPDLSVITKARSGGAEYIYSLLIGYEEPPAGLRMTPGQHFNKYMRGDLKPFMPEGTEHAPAGGLIAMAPPLSDGRVTFDDGTNPTLDQQAKDVAAFLAWASEPKMVERKQLGVAVLLYLFLFAGITVHVEGGGDLRGYPRAALRAGPPQGLRTELMP